MTSVKPLRAASIALLLLCIAALLTGCWSRVEINDRAFAVALFVDTAEENKVELTLGFPNPNSMPSVAGQGGSSKKEAYIAVSAIGMNIADAFQKMQSNLPREIFWGQVKIIVIGHDLAEKGISPVLEFMSRMPSFPLKTYIMVAAERAKSVSKFPTAIELFPAEVIRELAARRKLFDTSVSQFLIAQDYGKSAIANILQLSRSKQTGLYIESRSAALFHNNKLVGTIPENRFIGVFYMLNTLSEEVVTFSSPTDGKPISVYILHARTKIKPVVKEGKIIYDVKVKTSGQLRSSDSSINLAAPDTMRQVTGWLEEHIKKEILDVINRSRKRGADVFQFAAYLEWNHPRVWQANKKQWEDVYRSKISVNVHVQASIEHTGISKNTIQTQ